MNPNDRTSSERDAFGPPSASGGRMQIVDSLEANAAQALEQMVRLAVEEDRGLAYREGLATLDEEIEGAFSDGVLDDGERSKLAATFAAKGLDTNAIDRALGSDDPKTVLSDAVQEARARSESDAAERAYLLNGLEETYSSNLKAASEASNAEHRTYMTIIGNMKA